ncbi:hypothetical protein AB0B28_00495 [Glycomyces sp. NPDC046736]|uniref:hypothetical protein n=1 Tax=Glycomyces sp. NPDC046736 TaxID=3155615 RepID=UPI0033F86E44
MNTKLIRTYIRTPLLVFLLVGAATTAQGLMMVLPKRETWVGHWPATSASVSHAVLFGAIIASAAAAWVIAGPRRGRFQDLLTGSSRPPAAVYGYGLIAVAAGNLVGYAIVAVTVSAITAPEAVRGHLDVLELLPVLGSVAAAIAVGAVAGRVMPPFLAPAIGGVLPYAGYAAATYADVLFNRTLFMDLVSMDYTAREHFLRPPELLIAKAVLAIALGVALLSWMLGARGVWFGAGLVAGLALSATLLVAGVRIELPATYAVACTSDRQPILCVDNAYEHVLDDYSHHIDAELSKLPGLDMSGVVFVPEENLLDLSKRHTGVVPDLEPGTLMVVVPIVDGNTNPAHSIDPALFTANFGVSVLHQDCGTELEFSGPVAYEWWLELNELPTDGSNFPGEGSVRSQIDADPNFAAQRQRLAELTPTQQQASIANHWNNLKSCATGADSR